MKQVVKSLYVEIRRDEYEGLRARVAELEALQQSAVGVDERATFESWVVTQWHGAVFHLRDALSKHDPRYGQYVHDVIQNAWVGWQARAALTAARGGSSGGMHFATAADLAEALGNVKSLHDMSVELIAESVFAAAQTLPITRSRPT